MSDKESFEYVGKCIFCPLGEASKRGVVQARRMEAVREYLTTIGSIVEGVTKSRKMVTRYECGLGDIGQECIIPKLYERTLNDTSSLRDVPIA